MVLMTYFSLGFSIVTLLIILIQPLSLGFMIMLVSIFMSVMISFFFYLFLMWLYIIFGVCSWFISNICSEGAWLSG